MEYHTDQIPDPSRWTRVEKGFVMIARMLVQGYGVEDISVKTGLPVSEVRFVVTLMRESGSLSHVVRMSRRGKQQADNISSTRIPRRRDRAD